MQLPQVCIELRSLRWINDKDDPTDLCAHGNVYVRIADKVLDDGSDDHDWTLSAAALNLLRTLDRDYRPDDFAGQLIPCCGFFMYADVDPDHVSIYGCNTGIDWEVHHEGETVRHTADTGEVGTIGIRDYQRMVLAFADAVQQFYRASTQKTLSEDENDADRKGYEAFWREWDSLRSKWA